MTRPRFARARVSRGLVSVLVSGLLSGLLSGCSLSAQHVPLPGKGVSGDTYRLTATFSDALNLSEGAPVRLNGATVGQVQGVSVTDYVAKVDMMVQSAAQLHAGASARLRGTTPLGELYIDLQDGTSPAILPKGTTLGEGTVAPTIEDTMATTSVFLNGGGITELGTIVRESNRALGGREDRARDILRRLDRTTAELEASTDDLEQSLTSLAKLSTSLRKRRSTIRAALREVGPTAKALRSQIKDLARLLRDVERFGVTTTSVINVTHDDLVRSLRQMGPIFDQMNALEGDLTPAITKLVTFSKLLDNAVPTQYLNTSLHIHLTGVPSLPMSTQAARGSAPVAKPLVKPQSVTLPKLAVPGLVDPKPLIDTLMGLLGKTSR